MSPAQRRSKSATPMHTALAHFRAGRLDQAAALMGDIVKRDPRNASLLNNLGAVLAAQGRLAAAAQHYREAIALRPGWAEPRSNLGSVLFRMGEAAAAIESTEAAIAADPGFAAAYSNLGNILSARGEHDRALEHYRRALALDPGLADAHNNLGTVLHETGQHRRAIAEYRRAIELRPDYAEAYNNLGVSLQATAEPGPARQALARAVELSPGYAEAHCNLGNVLRELDDEDGAEQAYRRALELKPAHVPAHNNLGALLQQRGEVPEAIACYRRGIASDSRHGESHWNLALALLMTGDFASGWREYEWRWLGGPTLRHERRGFKQPQWRGKPIEGKAILLHAEQGMGDTIQFIRYAPLVAARGARVVIECQAELKGLLAGVDGVAQVIGRGEPLPAFDLHCPLLSLPLAFGTNEAGIPAAVPYIRAEPAACARWAARLGTLHGLRVGLAWAGSAKNLTDARRSIALPVFAPLAAVHGVHWISLQKGPAQSQSAAAPPGMALADFSRDLTDFAETAALIAQLDLVICVDTAVAHLAGALGKPVWLLNRFESEWRWMLEREDSPWYPTLRLFRQRVPRDWPGVIARVAVELGAFSAARTGAMPSGGALEQARQTARAQFQAGNYSEAARACQRVADLAPGNAEAWNDLGLALHRSGRTDTAVNAWRTALDLAPEYAEAHNNLGIAQRILGEPAQAEQCYRRAIAAKPGFFEAWSNLSILLAGEERFEEAIAACRSALQFMPDNASLHHQLGKCCLAQDRREEAAVHCRRAVAIEPNRAEYQITLGVALKGGADGSEAYSCFLQAATLDPQCAPARFNLALIHHENGRRHEALAELERAVAIDPEYADAYNNMGIVLTQLGEVDRALVALERALAIRPNFAGAHWNHALALLYDGRFAEGWREYEWRWEGAAEAGNRIPPWPKPVWRGEDIRGRKVLLFAEQGFGDTLQFVRYAPLVAARGARVSIECQPELKHLFSGIDGIDRVTARGEPRPDCDLCAPLLSLPLAFGTELDSAPCEVPYLPVDPAAARHWNDRLGPAPRPRVALVWAGSPGNRADTIRSIDLARMAPLATVRGIAWHSLQKGPAAQQASSPPPGLRLTDHSAELGDFAVTAAYVANMDLVICVDTAIAHLAGALGVPVWLLCRYESEWRWMRTRPDSPWYPTMRIFRQNAPGDWDGVIERVTQMLNEAAGYPSASAGAHSENHPQRMREARALFDTGALGEAAAAYRALASETPANGHALSNLGVVLTELRKFPEAVVSCQRAIALQPFLAEAHYNLACALDAARRLTEAEHSYRRAIALKPDYVDAWNNLGAVLQDLGDSAGAGDCYARALALHPDHARTHLNRAFALFARGDLAAAWPEYEWRLRLEPRAADGRRSDRPRWNGEPLNGRTILLEFEQGFGDTLQFIRYAAPVASRGGRVIVGCQPELKRLVGTAPGVSAAIAPGDPLPEHELHCPLLSLPLVFGTTLDTIPAPIPYLSPIAGDAELWTQRVGDTPALKVGIAWRGSRLHRADRLRSLDARLLAPLATVAGVRFYSLQKDGTDDAAATGLALSDHTADLQNFADTAGLVGALDLVICADTAIAHLAGALGKPVWLLNRFESEWRWMHERTDSPWYPRMRIFRQNARGDWPEVIERVTRELRVLARRRTVERHAPRMAAAVAHLDRGELAQAEAIYREITADGLDDAQAYNNLGVVLRRAGRADEAVAAWQRAADLDPESADALSNLGIALSELDRDAEAEIHLRRAIAIAPEHADAHNNLGNVLKHRDRPVEALACYHRALALRPAHAGAWNNLGLALRLQGKLDDAIDAYTRAIAADPDFAEAKFNRSLALLLKGDYAQGFREYEWRWKGSRDVKAPPRDFGKPRWSGEPLARRAILVHAEQGYGDAIQFARYAPMLATRGATVLLGCPPELARLFRGINGVAQIVSANDPLPEFDFHCPLLSLPLAFGTTLDSVPAEVPYLRADGKLAEIWKARLAHIPELRIGLAWAGRPSYRADSRRSLELAQLAPLAAPGGVHFVSLQTGEAAGDTPPGGLHIADFGADLHDFADTAALIANLDLVISVDTAVAHLAGALGKPVWLLNRSDSDWRWMLGREDTPWYPGMRIFRQSSAGDWASVIGHVALELCKLTGRGLGANADAAMALALKHLDAGDAALAERTYRDIIALDPDHAQARNNLAVALQQQGRTAEAVALWQSAVALDPRYGDAQNNLGTALRLLGRPQEAIECYRLAIGTNPDHYDACRNLAAVLEQQGMTAEAVASYRRGVELRPEDLQGRIDLGNALRGTGRLEEALGVLRQAVSAAPQSYAAWNSLGSVHVLRDAPDDAIAAFGRAAQIDPGQYPAHNNLGMAYQRLGNINEALACFRKAIECSPDAAPAHWNLALALLLRGDYAQGLPEYEWRWEGAPELQLRKRAFVQSQWRGEDPFGKTLLLHAEQGYGDTIQFVRYASLLAARGATVLLECHPDLKTLLAETSGVHRVLARGEPLPAFDLHCPLLSLPLAFGTTLESIPAEIPYIHADAQRVERWSSRLGHGPGLKIGLAWGGSPRNQADARRSIGLAALAPLAGVTEARFYSLQKGPAAAQIRHAPSALALVDLGDELKDFADTAAVIAQLDLVISVDTAVAHLAGAMGKPVWLLNRFESEWRWMLERSDSPWYPSMRLFRQRVRNDWRGGVAQVVAALRHLPKMSPGAYAGDLRKQGNGAIAQGLDAIIGSLPGGGETSARFNAVSRCRYGLMLYHRHDRYIGRSLERYGEFSESEVELFRLLVGKGDVVVEAGANFGAHTLFLAQAVGPTGTVHAFEPQPLVFQILCANMALNDIANVATHQAALGEQPGSIVVPRLDPGRPQNFGGLALGNARSGDTVPVGMIDAMQLPSCRLIKVDVEGMEAAVLRGAQETVARLKPALYVENDRRDRSAALIGLIRSMGYRIWWHLAPLFNPNNFNGVREDLFPNVASFNMLCLPQGAEPPIPLREVVGSDPDPRQP